jgi:hypothetical protein
MADIEQQLAESDLVRALVVAGLSKQWGVPEASADLNAVITRATPGTAEHLENLRCTIERLVDEIAEIRRRSAGLAAARAKAVGRSLAAIAR